MAENIKVENEAKSVEPKMLVARNPSFSKFYSTSALVTTTDTDFRVEIFNEKFKIPDGWVYQSDALIILTRESAKLMLKMLQDNIKAYEDRNGEIKVNEERYKLLYAIPK